MRKIRPLSPSGTRSTLLLGVALLLTSQAPALATNPCDPDLRPPADTPYAYRLRGELCEGIYTRDVAGKSLTFVSLTESVEDFMPRADKDLLLEWTAPDNSTVHVRAEALRPRLYYRMDASPPPGRTSLNWTPKLLKELQLTKGEIGLLVWTSRTVGDHERMVYIPLRLSQQQASLRSQSYKVVMLPGVELDEMFVSLIPVRPDGGLGKPVMEGRALDRGYYPAGRPIVIDLPSIPKGMYSLEVSAQLRGGGSVADNVWLYSPGT